MDRYQKIYYDYQTRARGLLDEKSLEDRFEKLSRWYASRLSNYLPAHTGSRCLDIPCGYGNFLYFLKKKGYTNIQGIDSDEKQVELARLMGLPADVGDAFDILSAEDRQYDLITSLDFIEHLSKDEAVNFLEICFRRLSPGGGLILRAPCADGPFGAHDAWNDLTHQWGMTSNVLRTLLEIQGFSDIVFLDERPQPTGFIDSIRWLVFFPAKKLADIFCMALGMRPPAIWSRSMFAVANKPS